MKKGYRVEEAKNPKAKYWRKVNVGPKRKTKKEADKVARIMRKQNKDFHYRVVSWKR